MEQAITVLAGKIKVLPNRPMFMLDCDVAEVYGTTTRALNQAVKRNPERFPEDFLFQITDEEVEKLGIKVKKVNDAVTDCDRIDSKKRNERYPFYGFTSEGCNMLCAVLHTAFAIDRSVLIMRAFSALERGEFNNPLDINASPIIPNGWQLHELRLIYGEEGCKAVLKDLYGIDPYGPKTGISYYEAQVINKNNPDKTERNFMIANLRDRGVMLCDVVRVSGFSAKSVCRTHKKYGGKGQRYSWNDPRKGNA